MPEKTKSSTKATAAGELKWRAGTESPQRDVAAKELQSLLTKISTWPMDEFASGWWPGDYRLLNLTCRQPGDLDVIVICQSLAGSGFVDVTVSAKLRSKGRTRALTRSERTALVSFGFGSGSGGRAELLHALEGMGTAALAERILNAIETAFGFVGRPILKFTSDEGSRLDEMPVLQNIRPHELLSLLHAAGFDAHPSDVSASHLGLSEPVISVLGGVPFTIALTEYDEVGFQTLRLSAPLARQIAGPTLNALNRRLLTGAAVISDDGSLELLENLYLAGGVSHAAIRNRIDDWVSSLEYAVAYQD
jgi:hypothetical protein